MAPLVSSGKTTFEDNVLKLANGMKVSSIDPIKSIALECGWDEEKDSKGRRLLSDLKRVLKEYNDYAFNQTISIIERYWFDDNAVIFIDCREPEEIKKFCKYFNGKSILIRRSSAEGAPASNSSDRNVLDYEYDIVIDNNGDKTDLAERAVKFIEEEGLAKKNCPYYVDLFGDIYEVKPPVYYTLSATIVEPQPSQVRPIRSTDL